MHAVLLCATLGMSSVTSLITYTGRAAQAFRCQTCGSKMAVVYED